MKTVMIRLRKVLNLQAVADPGFPRGGAPTVKVRAPTYYFTNFPQKLHEIEEI